MKRRTLVQLTATSASSILMSQIFSGCRRLKRAETITTDFKWRMPDESEPHERTWMAFGASSNIWGQKLLPEVQDNLVTIAKSITEYEPVYMLVREADYDLAAKKCGSSVNLVICPLDDLWMRDTGPVFVKRDRVKTECIDFNFNGWGQKQAHSYDAEVAHFVAEQVGFQATSTHLVLEGGAIEVDGHGTAMMTESSVLNQNRNPGMSKSEFEALLKPLLGLRKIIWLPGIRGRDITDGHIDFYARFARPGLVVAAYEPEPAFFDNAVTKTNLDVLRSETDADGRQLEVIVLENPQTIRPTFKTDEFAAGYINFYVVNGAVIIPEFGDDLADSRAKSILQDLYPKRDIIQLNIDAIAAGGGGIHCTTQQQPQA
ncbi:MAG: agmatine deiminase family protein [Leptolyngbya sp. SIO1D8]|nr:agmatine deiminase family protein [Leptolyngbya sp. SIO1D8]